MPMLMFQTEQIITMNILKTISPPEADLRHKQDNTTAYVNENCLGSGTLYVAER